MRPGKEGFIEGILVLAAIVAIGSPVLSTMALYRLGHAWLLDESVGAALPLAAASAAAYVALAALIWYSGRYQRSARRAYDASGRGKGVRASRRHDARRQKFKEEHPDHLSIPSRVRRRWIVVYVFVILHVLVAAAGVVVAVLALDMIEDLDSFTAAVTGERFTDQERLLLVGLMVLDAVVWLVLARLAWRKLDRIATRHRHVADQVRALAATPGWALDDDQSTVDGDWTSPPFHRVIGLAAMPRARAVIEGRKKGAAWLEGDFGPDALPYRSFTSRAVWAELPRQLAPVDFVPERMSDAIATLVGGRDVDVESYDFNRRWRVKASDEREAHGILQPRMIEFLNAVHDESLAFHVDGERVLIWDDGKDEDVDLAARVRLLDEFVDRLPGYLRTADPSGR